MRADRRDDIPESVGRLQRSLNVVICNGVDSASADRIRAETMLPKLKRWVIAARHVSGIAELLKIR